MPDRVQDLTNHRKVATACKNYTDQEIAKSEERMKWYAGEYTTTTSDDNTSASTKTVPANATRCKIKRIYGLTQKFNPTTAADDTSYMVKTMPETVYDFGVSKVEGASEVSENLIVLSDIAETTTNGITYSITNGILSIKGTATSQFSYRFAEIILNAGTYYFTGFYTGGGENTYYIGGTDGFRDFGGGNTITITSNNTTFRFAINVANGVAISGTLQLKPMLVKGSTAPSEFKVGFDNIHNLELSGLKVEGANLFDKNTYTLSNSKNLNDSGEVQGDSSNWYCITAYMPIKENTEYTLSGTKIGTQDWSTKICFYDENYNFIDKVKSAYITTTRTFTTPSGTKYWRYSAAKIGGATDDWILNRGSTALAYVPYIQPTTISVDLTTIKDSNNVSLFPSGKMMGDSSVADFITPYNQESRWNEVDLGTLNYTMNISNNRYLFSTSSITDIVPMATGTTVVNAICPKYRAVSQQDTWVDKDMSYSGIVGTKIIVFINNDYTSAEAFKTAMSGVKLQYERATYLTSNTDLSSLLRNIQGYSNGTITLQNTYNMDTANLITYNSIIKENCCAKMVQSRGGDVVATVNFTSNEVKYGWSAGSVYNSRDYSINTNNGIQYVGRVDLGSLTWQYNSANNVFYSSISNKVVYSSASQNILCANYSNANTTLANMPDKTILETFIGNSRDVAIKDTLYNGDTTIFKTAMNGVYLYYELATEVPEDLTPLDTNILIVEPGDTLAFFDSNDNPVIVPSDLTYRIEVAN